MMVGAATAQATPTFVGSWQVDQGPYWGDQPTAYSGQEAAALLFGGSASDYSVSTISADPNDIDYMSWVSVIYVGWDKVAQDFVQATTGLYLTLGDTSAYVWDNAQGAQFTNFAFRNDVQVPEPWTIVLVGLGLGVTAFLARRRYVNAR
jgi:hypothetical protein